MHLNGSERTTVGIIGAGPIGLAAAVQAIKRGLRPLVFEAGPVAGHGITTWSHVRMFSPWRYNTDRDSVELLERAGWQHPDREHFPSGAELVGEYLQPLAALPELADKIHYDLEVTAISRSGLDKLKSDSRDQTKFRLRSRTADGSERDFVVDAVIDTSGTIAQPNPLGDGGLPAIGENALSAHIFYGIPDVLDRDRPRYAGKRVMVAGSGDSAFNVLINLINLRAEYPGTQIVWAVRRQASGIQFGGGENDALPERGALGQRVRSLVEAGELELVTGFRTERVDRAGEMLEVASLDGRTLHVDEVIAVTGYRPDLEMLREIRLSLDPAVESPSQLAPLIDPNLHSCGTVRPHGALELAHPEPNFFIAGMKSYGRAPTFLMLTGYEQVRSIVAALAGDWKSARDVHLELPETGVCSTSSPQVPLAAGVASASTPVAEAPCCGPSCCS